MIDVERLLTSLLRQALDPVPVQNVVADDDLLAPLVLVTVSSGAAVSGLHTLLWRHTLDLSCFSPTRGGAKALGLRVYAAVHDLTSTTQPGVAGWLCTVTDQLAPTEVRSPDQPSGLAQFSARFTVITRA